MNPSDLKDMAGYEQKKGALKEDIHFRDQKLEQLKSECIDTLRHLALKELSEEQRFTMLALERKQLVDTIKLIAYRAKTCMVTILRETLSRSDDAHALLREIMTIEADIRRYFVLNKQRRTKLIVSYCEDLRRKGVSIRHKILD